MEDQDIKNVVEESQNEQVQEQQAPVEDKPYQVAIEDARKKLFKEYAFQRRLSSILMFVILGVIVGVMFMIMSNNNVLRIVGYCLAGAVLVGMVLYYVLTRNRFPNKTKAYVAFVSETLRNRMFNEKYSEVKCNPDEKFALADFVGDGVYKDATNIQSRNVTKATYKDHHFTYGEVALLRPSTRKQQVPPLFVGRYISFPNDLKFDGRLVFVYKNPTQPNDLPNAVDDLVVLEEKEDLVIYGPEGADYHKLLKGSFVNDLRRIKVENHLFNINIVIWAGHSAAYLSYDDTLMGFPFDKPFDYETYEQSYKDFDAVVKLLAGE